jgi:phosphoribosylformylglycinamidine synthase
VPGPRNPEAEEKLAILVRACMGLADICRAYKAPLISGKDSMKNDFDDGVLRLSVPPTLLISAMGKIEDATRAISMEFKRAGDLIYLLTAGTPSLAASTLAEVAELQADTKPGIHLPALNIEAAAKMYRALHSLIMQGHVHSAHDLSEGGLLVALAESVLGSSCGATIKVDGELVAVSTGVASALFGEGPGRIIVSIAPESAPILEKAIMSISGARFFELGVVTNIGEMKVTVEGAFKKGAGRAEADPGLVIATDQLREAWNFPLPFD